MKTSRNIAAQLHRNMKALNRRLALAVRHRSSDEIIGAAILYAENAAWLFCILATIALIVAGFFKPHCFFTAALYLVLSGVIRANIGYNRTHFSHEVDE